MYKLNKAMENDDFVQAVMLLPSQNKIYRLYRLYMLTPSPLFILGYTSELSMHGQSLQGLSNSINGVKVVHSGLCVVDYICF